MDKIESEIDTFLNLQNHCITNLNKQKNIIAKLVRLILKTRDNENTVFTMGNGGSGSTASHFVSDLAKTAITKNNKRIQAISLVDNIPLILAWSNDQSFDHIFVEQLKNLLKKDDIVIGFSGSGNSQNLINAFKIAKKLNAKCVGFTGSTGGKMKKFCDICIQIPSDEMLSIESQHVLLCHCIITAIRKEGNPLFTY